MADPTPEDFEMARQFTVPHVGSTYIPNVERLSRCYLSALSRMQAAERKVAELTEANAELLERLEAAEADLREIDHG